MDDPLDRWTDCDFEACGLDGSIPVRRRRTGGVSGAAPLFRDRRAEIPDPKIGVAAVVEIDADPSRRLVVG